MLKISLSYPTSVIACSTWLAGSTQILTGRTFLKVFRSSVFSKMWMVPGPDEHMKPFEYGRMAKTGVASLEEISDG